MITRFEELLQHNGATAAVAKATKSKRPLCVQKEGWIERRRKTQKKKRKKKNTVSIAEKGGEVWSEIKSGENFLDS